jgi:hypothetical protein
MEEDLMAMSLLYALLDVNDPLQIDTLVRHHPYNPDYRLAQRYRDFDRRQKREVRAALYRAVYGSLEYPEVNPALAMAIGKALGSAILGIAAIHGDSQSLHDILKPVVIEAIEDISP